MLRRLGGAMALALALVACGEPTMTVDDSGGTDGGGDGMDAGDLDAGGDGGSIEPCAVDEDCADTVFCDGDERCMPGATDADERGCVEAAAGPCAEGEVCDEDAATCDTVCADVDRDGHGDTACGGDDCDDADDDRYPGNVEVCDMAGHDEDCNTDTFGFLDADSDGSGSYVCCNVVAGGDLRCGDDCNDGDSTVNPRAGDGPPLYCDGIDNDCSSTADEGCPCVEGETQECGTEPQRMRIGICRPGTQVCSGGEFTATCIGAISAGEEICDALDNDCDGSVDEAVLRTYYPDVDGDGFGDLAGTPASACSAPAGYASNATDCDDTIASVNPGATEVCNARDDNCSGGIDEGFVATFYADADGDGFGNATMATMACSPPSGFVRNATDCDDANASRNPATIEGCNGIDDNCNGMTDEGLLRTFYRDVDGDAWGVAGTTTMACTPPTGYTDRSGDCDDARAAANPAGTEVCNGLDDNCAGGVDEGVLRTFYLDADHDSFGVSSSTMTACTAPANHSDRGGDCNDASASVSPAAAELCNGRDDNCDGATDTGCTCTDGMTRNCGPSTETGECTFGQQTCVGGSWGGCVGAVSSTTETCNGLDDDCDGTIDNGTTVTPCYRDGDGDGYGTGGATMQCRDATRMAQGYCPVGWVNNNTDCNDGVSAIRPGATETCDGVDQDCDGMADDGATIACYGDSDADGFGSGSAVQRCADPARTAFGMCPSGFTNVATDCNDGASTVRPGAPEICNDVDDDCDMMVDDGVSVMPCYSDADGDGYGSGPSLTQCRDATRMAQGYCPVGYTNVATDCNDGTSSIRPGATEVCNGLDDDCDGMSDEMLTATGCYVDGDSDGYGSGAASTQCRDGARASYGFCPVGYTNVGTDCNDSNGGVRPGATEACNGIDDDCDTMVDDGANASPCYSDADGDGYGAGSSSTQCRDASRSTFGYCPVGYTNVATDCNDGNSSVRPGGTETCNGLDDDCDGMTDELLLATGCYVDGDSDGYGAGSATSQCRDAARTSYGFCPVGYTNANGDCNDTNGGVRPGATETCNGVDDDCDTTVDDGATSSPCYADADGDGYGAGASSSQCRDASRSAYGYCPVGYTNVATDCNDGNSSVRPGGTETCNGLDDNCNGTTDESLTVTGCYVDGDSDGYGSGSSSTQCRDAARTTYGFCPVGYTNVAGDCSDTNSSVKPSATELCNGVDDDCDSVVDDGVTVAACYTDSDGDGYGAGAASVRCRDGSRMAYGYCPVGYTNVSTDCNDSNASVRPTGTETCNGIDDNCDGTVDEMLTVTGCYVDGDADGYGAGSSSTQCRDGTRMAYGYCPIGYTNVAGDCNNAIASIRPGGTEACNGLDDDCDTIVDDGVLITYYRDADNDGYGSATTTTGCMAPTGFVASGGDCDDGRANVHPSAPEVCNNLDENCVAGTTDEPTSRFYLDADSDGYGTSTTYMDACNQPAGYTLLSGDCNDGNSGVRPTATETCNGVDDDCDTTIDDGAAAQCAGQYPFAGHVATWTCSAGACGTTCAAGYANCDGNSINGCEIDITSDSGHCGSCTITCGTGALCESSSCDVLVDLVAGADNACAMWDSRRMICWGEGDTGTLSRDLLADEPKPVYIDELSALRTDTGAPVWDIGQGGVSGQTHIMAVTGDLGSNILYGWGWNFYGQIGDGTLVNPRISPQYATASGTDEVSAGNAHTCLRRSGNVYCWGLNNRGQLGDGAGALPGTNRTSVPSTAVVALPAVVQISVGADTSCARTSTGTVYCWGYAGQGQIGNGVMAPPLGVGYTTPQAISTYTDFIDVDVGYFHSCGLRTGGVPVCWGNGTWGALGNGATTTAYTPQSVNIASGRPTAYSEIVVGNGFSCGVASAPAGVAGQVWCWGRNTVGQLGIGTTDSADHPFAVRAGASVGLAGVAHIAAGEGFVCAGQSYGTGRLRIYCWGENDAGQLGRGTTSAPQPTPGLVVNIY